MGDMATRAIFMGSAELACLPLRALHALPGVQVVGVVTQPDRPKGRRLAVADGPVKAVAGELGLPVLMPEKVNAPESVAALRVLDPHLIVVVAYGQILREPLLGLPTHRCLNLHASLLPRYRGAAPIQWAIARGALRTGVTTMLMNAQMDAGDMLEQAEVAIAPDDTAGTLQTRLAETGAVLLVRTVPAWLAGTLTPQPQDASQVTFAPKLSKQDGEIDWTLPAAEIHNRVRGFNPWPGAFSWLPLTTSGTDRQASPELIKVHRVVIEAGEGEPGMVMDASGAGPLVACGRGAVRLLDVQMEGRKAMGGDAFLRGRPLVAGARMGRVAR